MVHFAISAILVWLAINIAFVALVPIALRPEVVEMAEQGRRFAAGLPATLAVGSLIYPPIVSPLGLIVATILAVFKPWGLIQKRPASTRDAR